MLTLLVAGSVWFWAILAIECVLLLFLIETERPGFSFLSLVGLGLLLKYFGNFDVFAWIVSNPGKLLMCFAGYLVVGTIWSIIKWWFFVRKHREKYLKAQDDYKRNPGMQWDDGFVYDNASPWETSYRRKTFLNKSGGLAPLARENKSRILMWMGYWPFSALWTIIDEPIKKAFRSIFNYISSTLQQISDDAFANIK